MPSFALNLVVGTIAGVLAFEIWAWLPTITHALDQAKHRIAAEPHAQPQLAERFTERRLASLAWSSWQLLIAFLALLRSSKRPTLNAANYGAALGGVFAITYVASSVLLGGAPEDIRGAFIEIAGYAFTGAIMGQLVALILRVVTGRRW